MRSRYHPPEWTGTLAYVVGLLTTDGNLSPDGRHLEFTSSDREQVQLLKDLLHLNNRIAQKSNGQGQSYYRIQFGNVVLYRWLESIGLKANKTHTLGALEIPDKHFWDFLRGHLDGDGSIKVYQDKVYPQSQRLYIYFNIASLSHMVWLRERISQLSEVQGHTHAAARVHRLIYAKTESLVLLRKMYYSYDVPCLQRKRALIEQFL